MRKFEQNKLWRDKAPELMEATGSVVHIKSLSDAEYQQCLFDKLSEEVAEVKAAENHQQMLEEIADVLEVVDAICKLKGIEQHEIAACKQAKYDKRGGFFHRQFVTIAEHQANSYGEKYCLAQPEKYPEVF